MSSMRGAIRIAALVLVLVVPILVSSPLGTSAASPQGSVVVRSVWSRALAQPVRTLVYLPPSYRPGGPRLPTLYLLHGTPGTPDGLFALGVQDRLDSLIDRGVAPAMIVVAPSGGPRPDSDTEWDDSVADAGARWGTFVTRDLVKAIDAAYATKHGRGSRAIAGISMGGYGAINLALGHSGHVRHRLELVGVLRLQHARRGRAGGLRDLEGALAAALGHPSGARAQAPADRDVVLLGPDGPLLRRERVVQQDALGVGHSAPLPRCRRRARRLGLACPDGD